MRGHWCWRASPVAAVVQRQSPTTRRLAAGKATDGAEPVAGASRAAEICKTFPATAIVLNLRCHCQEMSAMKQSLAKVSETFVSLKDKASELLR